MGKSITKKTLVQALAMAMALLTMTGCGQGANEVSSVTIDKDGHISNVIYETFDKEYYSLEELSEMASKEVSEYNSEYISPKISLDKVETVDDGAFVKLSMNYDSASDFSNFNDESLFYGTLEEAEAAGYRMSGELIDSNGVKIESSFAQDHPDRHIIITTDKSNIIAPFNIEYTSKGVTLLGKKEAVLESTTADSIQLLLSK
ncbi:MAG: hypothetical protein E7307_14040 [Butyrivibrio sp.]|nr:hypothetical protein [Butyrivibrio sp.]